MTLRAAFVALVLVAAQRAGAAPQRWPFLFDPAIAADPTATGNAIASGQMSLPDLPVASMQTLSSDQVTLWYWPESAALLTRIESAGGNATPMSWPTTPIMCKRHDSFVVPTLLLPNPSASCTSADQSIRAALANLGACDAVEQPERYALSYDPKNARQDTGNIEDLIGLAGQGLSLTPIPDGLLPADFVPTMRDIVDKVRHDKLAQAIAAARTSYAQAKKLASDNGACFDAAAVTTLDASIDALAAELDAAEAHLAKLDSDGNAARTHEEMCLAARGRVRNALPFPSLTEAERKALAFWLGGIYWRMRGGGLIPLGSTQDARIYFLLNPFTQLGQVAGGQDGADAAFKIYLQIFEGWSDWQDMGNGGGGGDKYADLVSMTSRGQRQVGTAVSLLGPRGYDTLALSTGGLHMGPCYFYAYYPLAWFRWAAGLTAPYSGYIDWPTATGEFCSGASIALGFAETLLAGKATGQPPTVMLCAGRSCGDDGCGGSCGACAAGTTCTSAGQCAA
ncbi:MAG: hypothetical protein LC659_01410, partial [Myxococcales bacterium]|nr:hypothetical protein [Myxococcales bacterium]